MKYFPSALTAVMALIVLAGLSEPALATTITPANTNFTATSTNSKLDLASGTISCATETISGNTGATSAATVTIAPIRIRWSTCTSFGGFPATTTTNTACDDGGAALNVDYTNSTDIAEWLTLASGCVITMGVPALGCSSTISGPQTLGNETSGTGGISFGNTTHVATLNGVAVTVVGTGSCPGGTGALTGSYVYPTSFVVDP